VADIVVDESIENGQWPSEFNGGWLHFFKEDIADHSILSLYFNEDHPEQSVIYSDRLDELPSAYVSWDRDGACVEIFVESSMRRNGIGRALCAYARSFALKNGIIFHAPEKMSYDAKMMYQNISDIYGEPFNDPGTFGMTIPYGYWGGIFVN